MKITRMSSRTRKQALLCLLVLTVLSIFASNAFGASSTSINPYIPPTKPTSALSSSISCGYYPNADGINVNKYFTVAYNGLGFIDFGYDNSNIYFHLAQKPSSVVRFDGKPITNEATKLVNAKAGELVIVSASSLAYLTNSLFLTFDEPQVSGGKVYFKFVFDPSSKRIGITTMDTNKNYFDGISSGTWSGPTPKGQVEGTLRTLGKVKVFGSQGLFLPVKPLNINLTSIRNFGAGSNFVQNHQSIIGRNSGAKSTQKLTYISTDNTGCEAVSYIEVK